MDAIAAAFKATISEAATAKRLQESQQMTLVLGGPAELDKFFKAQVQTWGAVVRDNKITAQQ